MPKSIFDVYFYFIVFASMKKILFGLPKFNRINFILVAVVVVSTYIGKVYIYVVRLIYLELDLGPARIIFQRHGTFSKTSNLISRKMSEFTVIKSNF